MSWNVLYLKPRCEKKMAFICQRSQVESYLPLRREVKIYQRRKVTVEKPVFPGYCFVDVNSNSRTKLLQTNLIIRIIEPEHEALLVHELDQVRLALTADTGLSSCKALVRGRQVRIRTGPFMGIEGVIWGSSRTAKVRLNVNMIGRALSLDVDRELLEVVD